MENEHKPTEEVHIAEPQPAELSAENIAERLTAELEKVVGIDQDVLQACVACLQDWKARAIENLLANLKRSLGEKLFPLLEMMAQHEQSVIAESGINGLGTMQTFKAAQILADIDEHHADKKRRKAARKSLYKLKSAGIEIETSHKALLGVSKHQPYKALISAIDGTGSQLIMLSEEMLAGDLQLLQVVTSDEEGILECSSKRGITKRMFEKLPTNFAREFGNQAPMLVEADYDFAASLVLEIEAITEELKLEPPGEYMSAKTFFGLDAISIIDNPVLERLNAENLKDQPYFLRASEELWKDDFFLGWLLPLNEIGVYAGELLDQEETVIELSPQFQQERKNEVYQRIIDGLLDEAAIKRLQRRLQVMAYVFMKQEKEDEAKYALAAALAFDEMQRPALKTHPFLLQLVVNSIEAARYVIEDGYEIEELDREHYALGRDDEGHIIVEIASEE